MPYPLVFPGAFFRITAQIRYNYFLFLFSNTLMVFIPLLSIDSLSPVVWLVYIYVNISLSILNTIFVS